jgi:Tfp pilus assembly protein PilP
MILWRHYRIFELMVYGGVALASLVAAVFVSTAILRPVRSAEVRSSDRSTTVPAATVPAPVPTSASAASAASAATSASVDSATAFLEPYLYDTREGRRNPFKPTTLVEPGALNNQFTGPGTPLERFELDELKLLAIIWNVKNPRAMFMDPMNVIHTVGKDDRIGRKRGYIAVIREGEVVVVESTTYSGEPVFSTRVLRMD